MSEIDYLGKIVKISNKISSVLRRIERMEHIIDYYSDILFVSDEGLEK